MPVARRPCVALLVAVAIITVPSAAQAQSQALTASPTSSPLAAETLTQSVTLSWTETTLSTLSASMTGTPSQSETRTFSPTPTLSGSRLGTSSSTIIIGGTVALVLVAVGVGVFAAYWFFIISRRRGRSMHAPMDVNASEAYGLVEDVVEASATTPVILSDAAGGNPAASEAMDGDENVTDMQGGSLVCFDTAFPTAREGAAMPDAGIGESITAVVVPSAVEEGPQDVVLRFSDVEIGSENAGTPDSAAHLQQQPRAASFAAAAAAASAGGPTHRTFDAAIRSWEPRSAPPPAPSVLVEKPAPRALYFQRRPSLGAAGISVAGALQLATPSRRHSTSCLADDVTSFPSHGAPFAPLDAASAWAMQRTQARSIAASSLHEGPTPDGTAVARYAVTRGDAATPPSAGRRGGGAVVSAPNTALISPLSITSVRGAGPAAWEDACDDDSDRYVPPQPGFVEQGFEQQAIWADRRSAPVSRPSFLPATGASRRDIGPEHMRRASVGGVPASLAGDFVPAGRNRRRSLNDVTSALAAAATAAAFAGTAPAGAIVAPDAARDSRDRPGLLRRTSLALIATALLAGRQ